MSSITDISAINSVPHDSSKSHLLCSALLSMKKTIINYFPHTPISCPEWVPSHLVLSPFLNTENHVSRFIWHYVSLYSKELIHVSWIDSFSTKPLNKKPKWIDSRFLRVKIDSALVGASSFQWGETQPQFVYLSFQLLGRTVFLSTDLKEGARLRELASGRGITQPSLCSIPHVFTVSYGISPVEFD